MNEIIIYPLKVSVCITLLYGFYLIALRKETHFGFNRLYLLFSTVISLIIPLLNIPLFKGTTETGFSYILQTVQINSDTVLIPQNTTFSFNILAIIYLTGISILLLRFLIRYASLIVIRQKCIIKKKDGLYIALSKKQIAPFSFFKTIFINENAIDEEQMDKIIMHENVHISQLHSLDIIFAEIICMLTWFNPVSWMIKAALKETHEYLADYGVSEQTPNSTEYFLLLIKNAIGVQPGLANNLNKSLTLKRLNMMKKPRSGRLSKLKALLVLPLVALLFITLSCTNSKEELKSDNTSETQQSEKKDLTVDKMPEFPGGQAAMSKFIIDNVKYPLEAKKSGIQGKVFVKFTVTKTGKLDKISISQKVNELLDAEALRVISNMPDWIPGSSKDSPVDVEMTLPISFKLA